MALVRRNIILALVAAFALAVAGTAVAKPTKRPFRTGQYSGTLTSAISGKEPAERTVRLTISKIGKRYKLQISSFVVKVTCNNKLRSKGMSFRVIWVSKKNGNFSGKTARGNSPGTATITGQAKGKQINATWNYSVPDGTCWGNGNVTATHS